MPLRSDPTAWFNLPGIVAAYQPIAAPGPLIARYNQAHGGDNRFKAIPGVAPAWDAVRGWVSSDGTHYLNVGFVGQVDLTIVIRFSNVAAVGNYFIVGQAGSGCSNRISPRRATGYCGFRYGNDSTNSAGEVVSGVMALARNLGYVNGVQVYAPSTTYSGTPETMSIMGTRGTTPSGVAHNVQAIAIYNRALSAAEVWSVSRQMQYCEVNPDWSAWGRRRKWYYAPAAEQVSEITGQGAVTLAGITPSATGTVEVAGTASATIANLTGQSAGLVDIAGVGDGLLSSVSGQAAGAVEIAGAGVVTFAALLPSANGSVAIAGTASVTLAGIAGTATASVGEVPVIGQGSITLANLTGQAAAAVAIAGNGEITVSVTGQAIGAVSISGIAAITLVDIAETATGQVFVLGSAAVQFAAMVAAATGTVTTYIPATQHIGLTLKQRSFEWHMKDRP